MPYRNTAIPGDSSASPRTSSRCPVCGLASGSIRQAATTAAAPTGRLMKKIHRQFAALMIAPPITGPKTGASSIGTPITLITRPIRAGPAAWARIVCPTGRIIPAPRPWMTRKPISDPADQAAPASTEPARNSSRAASHTRLAPSRSAAHPVTGMTEAKASM